MAASPARPTEVVRVTSASQGPEARLLAVERSHHGHTVVDHYEWLRDKDDPDRRSPTSRPRTSTPRPPPRTWNRCGRPSSTRSRAAPRRTTLRSPTRQGQWWYYSRTIEGAQYTVHCRCPADPDDGTLPPGPRRRSSQVHRPSASRCLLDGNAAAEGHGFFSLGGSRRQPRRPAAGLRERRDRVTSDSPCASRTCSTGELLADEVPELFYGFVLATADGPGSLFYTVVDDAWRPYQVRRHVLGTAADDDDGRVHRARRAVLGRRRGDHHDRRYLLIGSHSRTTSEVLAARPGRPGRRADDDRRSARRRRIPGRPRDRRRPRRLRHRAQRRRRGLRGRARRGR